MTFVGLYADSTFSSVLRETCGALDPQPSFSSSPAFVVEVLERALVAAKERDPAALCVGVKTGLEAIGGGGPLDDAVGALSPEYLEPEASSTLRMILSGVRSRSDRAVI